MTSGIDPWALGRTHELGLGDAERATRGAWYTPRAVAEEITALAFDAIGDELPRSILDPTCGGGAFLLAALEQLVGRGCHPADALSRIHGLDSNRDAVEACRAAIDAWAIQHDAVPVADLVDRIVVGDALDPPTESASSVDLVVGNPPFATPLKDSALPQLAHDVRLADADLLGPYADLAAIHLLAAVRRVRAGGVVAMVLPQSLLAGRDTAGLRAHLASAAPIVESWATRDRVFDANVRVWAPVLAVGGDRGSVRRGDGWAPTVATALGAPSVELDQSVGHLRDLVQATAGFRDEYYAVAEACCEGSRLDGRARVVTVGSIDPLSCLWGDKPTTFAKQRWVRPVVDASSMSGAAGGWVRRQLVPKVVLPTQSKVFEPFVDRVGNHVPVTPLLSLHAAEAELDQVAAVLLAPPVVLWAHRRWFGSALSVDAIKLAAKDVMSIPLPADRHRWSEAAGLVVEGPAAVDEIGRLMTLAYGADLSIHDWWRSRLPRGGGGQSPSASLS